MSVPRFFATRPILLQLRACCGAQQSTRWVNGLNRSRDSVLRHAGKALDRRQTIDPRDGKRSLSNSALRPMIRMTRPHNRRYGDRLDGHFDTVSFRRVDVLKPARIRLTLMPRKAHNEGHHAEVAERAVSATLNSLKSHRGRKVKSPLSNIRAVTPKLCVHSEPASVHPQRVWNRP